MSKLSSGVQECIASARLGNVEAREELFRLCRNYLSLIARATTATQLQTRLDASDVVQQTLLDAHRDFAQFRGNTEQEWLTWLRQILQHNVVDAARFHVTAEKRAADREQPLLHVSPSGIDASETQLATAEPSPSEHLILHEQSLLLTEAIERLTSEYREIIILRNVMRLPFDEIAIRLKRSRPAAQMLWMRAIDQLRERMRDVGITSVFQERTP